MFFRETGERPAKKIRLFKDPIVDDSINDLSRKQFAPESKCKIRWAVNMYNEWRRSRISVIGCPSQTVDANLEMLHSFTPSQLGYALCRFVTEVRRLDGKEYPPNTIRELVICIQMFLHENCIMWRLLEGSEFTTLRNVVDNTMKERHGMGLGVRKSSEYISKSQEDLLYSSGQLGIDDPQQLLNNVIYLLGVYLALRGGVEHSNLRRDGCNSQLSIEKDSRGIECLVYHEDPLQKTNQGGLKCKGKNKTVWVYPVEGDLARDPVFVYKKYIGLLPVNKSCPKLYLRPRKKISPSCWYCDQAYGINKVKTTVREICKKAGLVSRFTNHSLRATCATRMFEHNVPEQIIKETTGHKSDCVRFYKRTSEELRQAACATIAKKENNKALAMCDEVAMYDVLNYHEKPPTVPKVKELVKKEKFELNRFQMLANVIKTRMEMRKKLNPKGRLSLKKYKGHKVTIDVNLNVRK